jgi:hypothetical protein
MATGDAWLGARYYLEGDKGGGLMRVPGIRVPTLAAAVVFALSVQAQPATTDSAVTSALAGTVVDTTGVPVPYAEVFLVATSAGTYADGDGHFRLANLRAEKTRFGVRRIGYAPVYFDIELPAAAAVSLEVRMRPTVRSLSTVEVHDDVHRLLKEEGFFDRLAAGNGLFVTPEMIAATRPSRATDALMNIPNVVVDRRGQRTRIVASNQRCEYGLIVDKMRVGVPGSRVRTTSPDDLVSGTDIFAIEVYPRNRGAPAQFVGLAGEDGCGTIVVWTKWMLRR